MTRGQYELQAEFFALAQEVEDQADEIAASAHDIFHVPAEDVTNELLITAKAIARAMDRATELLSKLEEG